MFIITLRHTTEVVDWSKRDCTSRRSKPDDDLELILIAAWFHDLGYIKTCEGHENVEH